MGKSHFQNTLKCMSKFVDLGYHKWVSLSKRTMLHWWIPRGKSTKLPAIAGCNLIRLGMKEFIRVHGFEPLNLFECPTGFDPLLFSTFCVYYYTECENEKEEEGQQEDKGHVGVNSMGVGDADGTSNRKAQESTSTSKKKC